MRQIPDKPLARPGRLPSDIDGDTTGPLRQLSEEDEAAAKRAEELKPIKQKLEEFSEYVMNLELPDVGKWTGDVAHVLTVASDDILNIARRLK